MKEANDFSPTEGDKNPRKSDESCAYCGNSKLVECNCTEGFGAASAYSDCLTCGGCGTMVCQNCSYEVGI